MPRKRDAWNIGFHFYECPICHKKGSIGFLTDATEDQHFKTACEHAIPITVEGSEARDKRLQVAHQSDGDATETNERTATR